MEAGEAVARDDNVLVAAPTGAGKTVVGEMAVAAALETGGRAFYTAPIKALSNQKYNDLRAVLGDDRVGLLTGDHSINARAPVVVMTTEVLRNMVYAGSEALDDLRWVVLDEVHFLQDAYRGPVWEEVLIHAPAPIRFACLSATVSNSAELGAWIGSLRGPTATVVEHRRPVPLDPLLMVGDRHAEADHLVPLLVDGRPNPRGQRFDGDRSTPPGPRGGRGRPRRRFRTPRRLEVVERLAAQDMLPAIHFIFSRAGCDEAAAGCLDAGLRLNGPEEAAAARAVAEEHAAALDDSALAVLGWDRFAEMLSRGIAAHHAGMVPAFREAVENCFVRGLVKVVFATETLALGINMPARTVVIERLTKFTGDGHDMLTPSQFTQLTGRAGRRGIDDQGFAVVLWSPFVAFAPVAELAASREYPLSSAFRPTYNMAVNLLDRYGPSDARGVLGRSFAQFQADAAVAGDRVRRTRAAADRDAASARLESIEGVTTAAALEYLDLVTEEQRRRRRGERGRSAVERSLAALAPGDVIERPTRDGPRLLVVVSVSERKRSVRVEALTARGNRVRIDATDEPRPIEACGTVQLPVPYLPNDAGFRREAAARLRRVNRKRLRPPRRSGGTDELTARWREARDAAQAHPLHAHPRAEEVLDAARGHRRAERDRRTAQQRLGAKGTDLVARFDAVLAVLVDAGHLTADGALTAEGARLRRIYHECDLLLSEAVGEGLLDGLDPAELAALVSCVTHEHRSADPPPPPRLPTRDLQERFEDLVALAGDLRRAEEVRGLPPTRPPSAGFSLPAYRWVGGLALGESLAEDMSGGDFVRNARQLIDVLRQVGDVATGETSHTARTAARLLLRDVVEAGGGPR